MQQHKIAALLQIEYLAGRTRTLRIADSEDLAGFVGEFAECHENALRWTSANRGSRVVEGWVATNEWLFEKHSVVTTRNGDLLCITPKHESAFVGPFIEYQDIWDEAAFSELPPQVMVPMVVPL